MQLSQDQIRWAQSHDPRDAARLRGSLGIGNETRRIRAAHSWDIYHQINNFFGTSGGGSRHDLNNGADGWSPDGNWHSIVVGASSQFAQSAGVAAGARRCERRCASCGRLPGRWCGHALQRRYCEVVDRRHRPTRERNACGRRNGRRGGHFRHHERGAVHQSQLWDVSEPRRLLTPRRRWDFFNDKGYQFASTRPEPRRELCRRAWRLNSGCDAQGIVRPRCGDGVAVLQRRPATRWMEQQAGSRKGSSTPDRNFGLGQFSGDQATSSTGPTRTLGLQPTRTGNGTHPSTVPGTGGIAPSLRAGDQWDRTFDNNNPDRRPQLRLSGRASGIAISARTSAGTIRASTTRRTTTDANRNLANAAIPRRVGQQRQPTATHYAQLAQMLSGNLLTGAGAGAAPNSQGSASSLVSLFSALAPSPDG